MNLSMRLTLDGLVRAMRARAHEVAEALESGREAPDERELAMERQKRADRPAGGSHDGRHT